jgi:hypothetical protein
MLIGYPVVDAARIDMEWPKNFGAHFINLRFFYFCLMIRIHNPKLGIHGFRFVTKSAVPDHMLCQQSSF